jgi:Ice-binding-like
MGTRSLYFRVTSVIATSSIAAILALAVTVPPAFAAQAPVGMGTAASFAVLAGSTVTNTGPSVVSGSIGLSPGTAITGFPPGTVINGSEHAADAVALQAQSDLTTAYNSAAGRTPVTVESNPDLGGDNLAPGVYKGTSTLSLTGAVILNGENNANSVFIFQAGSTLITASSSTVSLINGASWCNVFWQVGSSATLGTGSTFVGTVMALTSGTLNTGATVMGRMLARNGAVTLDDNVFTQPACTTSSSTTTTTTASGGTNTGGGGTSGRTSQAKASGTTGTTSPVAGTATKNGVGGGGSTGNGLGGGVVPVGFPATGLGGASRSTDPVLLVLGSLALIGAVLAMGEGFRRRYSVARCSGEPNDGDV